MCTYYIWVGLGRQPLGRYAESQGILMIRCDLYRITIVADILQSSAKIISINNKQKIRRRILNTKT